MHLWKFLKIQNPTLPSYILLIVNMTPLRSATSRFEHPANSYNEYIKYDVQKCFADGYASPISGSRRIEDGGMLFHMRSIPLVK